MNLDNKSGQQPVPFPMTGRKSPGEPAVMTLADVCRILEAEVIVGANLEEVTVDMACGADLMSDVLAFSKQGALLLTGLTNAQAVRTSYLADISAICFVRGKRPSEETRQLAAANNLPLLATDLPMFEACGRLYHVGLRGCSDDGV